MSILKYFSPVAAIGESRFFKDTIGGGAAQRDIQAAKGRADSALDTGYNTGRGDYERAGHRFDDYAATGGNAMRMYADATGVNGRGAYQGAVDNFAGDPFRQGNEDFAQRQLGRSFAPRGMRYSGNAMLAAARGSMERGSTDWNNWLNRIQGQGEQGFRATGAQAGVDTGMGDMAMGYGQTKAGNEINYGNAMASNRGTLMNNLMGLAGVGGKIAGAYMGKPG